MDPDYPSPSFSTIILIIWTTWPSKCLLHAGADKVHSFSPVCLGWLPLCQKSGKWSKKGVKERYYEAFLIPRLVPVSKQVWGDQAARLPPDAHYGIKSNSETSHVRPGAKLSVNTFCGIFSKAPGTPWSSGRLPLFAFNLRWQEVLLTHHPP